MYNIEVSVIVCTYNPDYEKLKQTLFSAIKQKNIEFEIIIADDGSEIFEEKLIKDIFKSYEFEKYKIVRGTENKGTVTNYYQGILCSKGKYIYGISPGDYFYNPYVLSNLYNFCMQNDADMCFGDAVCYYRLKNEIKLSRAFTPKWPRAYDTVHYNSNIATISFFSRQQPIGATYFRKKAIAEKYFSKIAGQVKYLEDYPSTALYLLDGLKMYYYRGAVVWYECNTGISNSNSVIWKKCLDEDFEAAKTIILAEYSENNIVRAKYASNLFGRILHPIVCLTGLVVRIMGEIRYRFLRFNEDTEKINMILNYDDKFTDK